MITFLLTYLVQYTWNYSLSVFPVRLENGRGRNFSFPQMKVSAQFSSISHFSYQKQGVR